MLPEDAPARHQDVMKSLAMFRAEQCTGKRACEARIMFRTEQFPQPSLLSHVSLGSGGAPELASALICIIMFRAEQQTRFM